MESHGDAGSSVDTRTCQTQPACCLACEVCCAHPTPVAAAPCVWRRVRPGSMLTSRDQQRRPSHRRAEAELILYHPTIMVSLQFCVELASLYLLYRVQQPGVVQECVRIKHTFQHKVFAHVFYRVWSQESESWQQAAVQMFWLEITAVQSPWLGPLPVMSMQGGRGCGVHCVARRPRSVLIRQPSQQVAGTVR